MPGDAIQINHWKQLEYHDPAQVLANLRIAENRLRDMDMPEDIRNLRTNKLKELREGRDAALFSLGMSHALGVPVGFARHEASDYDFIITARIDNVQQLSPVQLKEWVPPDLNPEQTLDDILSSIQRKYLISTETTVAIRVNRPITLDITRIDVPDLPVDGVWLFGCTSADQSDWFLYGNLLTEPRLYPYSYPEPAGYSAT